LAFFWSFLALFGFLLKFSSGNHDYHRGMGVRRGGGKTGIPPLEKREIRNLILIIWVNSCIDSLFADVTLTLHKSQVHSFGNMLL